MDGIRALHREGNTLFSKAGKDTACVAGTAALKNACVLYGQCVEAMVEFEVNGERESLSSQAEKDEFDSLKVTIFLNLGISNMKLGSLEGCRRCCNVALLYCNNPCLGLQEMDIDPETDIVLTEPVLTSFVTLATKALFRRGKCFQEMGCVELAMKDFQGAQRLSPNIKMITDALTEVESLIDEAMTTNESKYKADGASDSVSTASVFRGSTNISGGGNCGGGNGGGCGTAGVGVAGSGSSGGRGWSGGGAGTGRDGATMGPKSGSKGGLDHLSAAEVTAMTVNGGPCLLRRAMWCQTVGEARVYVPLPTLLNLSQQWLYSSSFSSPSQSPFEEMEANGDYGPREFVNKQLHQPPTSSKQQHQPSHLTSKAWRIVFEKMSVRIYLWDEVLLELELEYLIKHTECVWMLESYGGAMSGNVGKSSNSEGMKTGNNGPRSKSKRKKGKKKKKVTKKDLLAAGSRVDIEEGEGGGGGGGGEREREGGEQEEGEEEEEEREGELVGELVGEQAVVVEIVEDFKKVDVGEGNVGSVTESEEEEENRGKDAAISSPVMYLVLYLQKAPSFEWFPGCEWWDRVFVGDEPIETSTCTISTDTSQLSQEARDRAQKEHERFQKLSPEQQEIEMSNLTKAKMDFLEAYQRTQDAANQEDRAIAEVPERAEMLEALRRQFPNIDFTAK